MGRSGLVETGRELARYGDIEGAVAQFKKALDLDPDLDLDPVPEAKRWAAWELVLNGQELSKTQKVSYDFSGYGLPDFLKVLFGVYLAKTGRIDEAIVDFTKAIEFIPNYTTAYNSLCWWGSLLGRAADVIDACDRAVELAPSKGDYRGSRGLARALIGDSLGAIEDFKSASKWWKENEPDAPWGDLEEEWIIELEAGRNPFDEETLETLRNE